MTSNPNHQDRIRTVASHLRTHGSVAIAKKHVPDVRAELTPAEDELTFYKPFCSPGEDYEAGLLEFDKEVHHDQ